MLSAMLSKDPDYRPVASTLAAVGSWLPADAVGTPLAEFASLTKRAQMHGAVVKETGSLPGVSILDAKGDPLEPLREKSDPWEFLPRFEPRLSEGAAAAMRAAEKLKPPTLHNIDERTQEFADSLARTLCF